MKTMSFISAVDFIGNLPGDTSLQVYFNMDDGTIVIREKGDDLSEIQKAKNIGLLCSGQPDQFFEAIKFALYRYFNPSKS